MIYSNKYFVIVNIHDLRVFCPETCKDKVLQGKFYLIHLIVQTFIHVTIIYISDCHQFNVINDLIIQFQDSRIFLPLNLNVRNVNYFYLYSI